MINSLGPSSQFRSASPALAGGIPMAPDATPAAPQESVTIGAAQAVPNGWTPVQTGNGIVGSVLHDQATKQNKAVVAQLMPGLLVPAGLRIEWDAEKGASATLVDKPNVKLQPVAGDDGQIYVPLEPAGGNPNAPYLVFNPHALSHGLSDGMRPDGQGGLTRATQEYQNADGSFTVIADEHRTQTPDGVAKTYTRIDSSQAGLTGKDVQETPVNHNAQQMEIYATAMLTSGLSLLAGGPKGGPKVKETEVQVTSTPGDLAVTHPPDKKFPSLGELGAKASEYANAASTSASNLNQTVSKKLGGKLKEMWDFGMQGGMLGSKGYNVGQGWFNKGQATPPTPPPAAEPPRVTHVHPFSAAMATAPGALFPGLMALLQG